jgi:hypothetical protein
VNLRVDRLTLRLAGISEADGRRLAQLVGEHLAGATPPAAAGSAGATHLAIEGRPGEALESVAQRIVAGMLQSIARAL